MFRKLLALSVLGLCSCATYQESTAYIGHCVNWTPHYIGKYGRRMDTLPEQVLIEISSELSETLLRLASLPNDGPRLCWYRIVKTGGIALRTTTNSYHFELVNGQWMLTQTYDVVRVN